MNKLKMHTPDLTQDHISRIRELFPNCVTEIQDDKGQLKLAIDFDALKQELSDSIVEGPQERYHLNWPGKREALFTANAPMPKTLRPAYGESVDFDKTKNLFIEGDNLEALKLLQETYLGKVKMIYIDPPYNTGRNLIYKNDFSEGIDDFLERSQQIDDGGNQLVANPETNGRFHSDWLSMIYSRLRLAKNLLAKDGVLVCAIDENEQATLGLVLKEVFGEGGYEHVCVTIIHNPRGIQGANFSYNHEYAYFVYPRGTKAIGDKKIEQSEVSWSQFRNWGGESERTDAKNCFYPVLVKDGKIIGFEDVSPDALHPQQTEWSGDIARVYPIDKEGVERKWRYARQSVDEIAHFLRAKKTQRGFEIEIGKDFALHKTVWNDTRYDANEYGTKIVNSLVKGAGFTFPKSLWTVYDSVHAVCGNDKSAIVLDFFAGSSTTSHAVMQLNADDGGNRRFIMVQFPEPCDEKSDPFKAGFKNIAEISKERIRRAGEKLIEADCNEGWNKDIGFRVLKIDTSNMDDSYYQRKPDDWKQSDLLSAVDNIKQDRKPEDLLFQVLLDWGVDLTLPITKKTVQGKTIFFVDGNALVACFDTGITEELVKELAVEKPVRVVFRDNGFASDSAKINAEQIFKQMSPGTDVKSI